MEFVESALYSHVRRNWKEYACLGKCEQSNFVQEVAIHRCPLIWDVLWKAHHCQLSLPMVQCRYQTSSIRPSRKWTGEIGTAIVPYKMLSRKFWYTCFIVIAQNLSATAADGEGAFPPPPPIIAIITVFSIISRGKESKSQFLRERRECPLGCPFFTPPGTSPLGTSA